MSAHLFLCVCIGELERETEVMLMGSPKTGSPLYFVGYKLLKFKRAVWGLKCVFRLRVRIGLRLG